MVTPMDVDSMSVSTPAGVFMVAERAVGLAVGDLRAEIGVQLNEVKIRGSHYPLTHMCLVKFWRTRRRRIISGGFGFWAPPTV